MKKLLAAAAAALAVGGLTVGTADAGESKTIAEIVVESTTAATPEFTTLLAAVQAASPDVLAAIDGCEDGPYTVFAPTDAAFAKIPKATLTAVLADQAMLTDILLYHVVSGKITAADAVAAAGTEIEALNGDMLAVSLDGSNVKINSSTVVSPDVNACNGVIHVIDTVLMPPSEMAETGGNAATMAMIAAGLLATGLMILQIGRRRTVTA